MASAWLLVSLAHAEGYTAEPALLLLPVQALQAHPLQLVYTTHKYRNQWCAGSGSGSGSGSDIKWNKKIKKSTQKRWKLSGQQYCLRKDFVQTVFYFKNCAQNVLDPDPERVYRIRDFSKSGN